MKLGIDVKREWDGETFKQTIIPKVESKSVREAALFCQGQAVLLCPVDKGRLRGSISVKLRGQESIKNAGSGKAQAGDFIKDEPMEKVAHVGTNVFYSEFIEFGTAKMGAQPYLRPAADLTEGKSVTIVERAGKAEFENYRGL